MSKRVQEIVRETLNVKHLGKTKAKSFYYEDKGLVPAGLEYHAHYTRGGQIFYMTGKSHDKTSKIINPIYPIDVQDDKQKYQLLSNNFNFVRYVHFSLKVHLFKMINKNINYFQTILIL